MKKAIGIILSIMMILVIALPAAAATTVANTAVTNISLNRAYQVLKVGQTFDLTAELTPVVKTATPRIKYKSANTKVVTVDQKTGKIKAIGLGTTTVTCTSVSNAKIFATADFTVAPAKSSKDSITVAINSDPADLSPFKVTTSEANYVKHQIYETMFKFGYDMKVTPVLATSWEKKDDVTYVFHLKKGIKYSNGVAMTAKDVLWSIKLASLDFSFKAYVARVDQTKCKVIDDLTVQIVFDRPDAFMFGQLACGVYITNEANYNASKDGFTTTPIGTGPYTVGKWVSGSNITLTANPDYWDAGYPMIKNLNFQFIAEPAQRTTSLISGQVDVVMDTQNSDYNYIVGTSGFSGISKVATRSNSIYLNMTKYSAFFSKDLRQALCYAIDNVAVTKVAFGGFGKVNKCITAEGMKDYSKAWETAIYKTDMAKAKKLVASSDVSKDTVISIFVNGSQAWQAAAAQMIQQWLKELGFNSKITNFENAVYGSTIGKPDSGWDISFVTTTSPSGYWLDSMNAYMGNLNYPKWSGPNYDKFIALGKVAAATTNLSLMAKNTAEMVRMMQDDVPIFAMNQNATNFTFNSKLNFRVWDQNSILVRDLFFK